MKHSELLVAISDLDPIDARGSFQRHCSLRWDGLRPSAAGGRWGERGAFEVQDRADEPWSPMRAERDLFFVGTAICCGTGAAWRASPEPLETSEAPSSALATVMPGHACGRSTRTTMPGSASRLIRNT